MDQNSKNIDCYFYFYSECVRGDYCKFRHEPIALGVEVVCSKWKAGNCTEPHCGLRHMELKKKRKEIPCYWEKQPGGCRKAHCAFKHQNRGSAASGDAPGSPESSKKDSDSASQDWKNSKTGGASSLESTLETSAPETSRRLSQVGTESYSSSPAAVEPIVVNFEEESDSESAPSWTPTKVPKEKDSLHVKTLEEIRLEKIQAESAAYWEGIAGGPMAWEAANPAVNPPAGSCGTLPGPRKLCSSSSTINNKKSNLQVKSITKDLDFRVLTLDEIRRNRAKRSDPDNDSFKEQTHHSANFRTLTNGFGNGKSRSHLELADLRAKISSSKCTEGSELSYHTETLSSKRLRQETSPQSGPSKKQRIKVRRISDLTGEVAGNNIPEVGLYGDGDVDGHIIGDIDRLLME
ncbi:hypothetical protein ONE63_006381 [Megalurothrips usitatus]|uniref:C3H1-type domain-containing protein n=1 Tax=Megalurothrips usitatus TaxID=439358 RepID=A0AAV7Y0L3_9NEOP|nr:hypothetical protein ONE63_006381 [Megalurothrips usitatus]